MNRLVLTMLFYTMVSEFSSVSLNYLMPIQLGSSLITNLKLNPLTNSVTVAGKAEIAASPTNYRRRERNTPMADFHISFNLATVFRMRCFRRKRNGEKKKETKRKKAQKAEAEELPLTEEEQK